jgi:hypothetical protein
MNNKTEYISFKNRVSAALLKTEYAAYIYPRKKQSTAITEKTKYLAAVCITKQSIFLETGEASRIH